MENIPFCPKCKQYLYKEHMKQRRKLTRSEKATIAKNKGKSPWAKTMRAVVTGII